MSFKMHLLTIAFLAALSTQAEARKLAPHMQKQLVAGHDKIKQSGSKVSATLSKVVETLKANKECSQEDLLVAIREVQSQGHLLRGARPHPMSPMNRTSPNC